MWNESFSEKIDFQYCDIQPLNVSTPAYPFCIQTQVSVGWNWIKTRLEYKNNWFKNMKLCKNQIFCISTYNYTQFPVQIYRIFIKCGICVESFVLFVFKVIVKLTYTIEPSIRMCICISKLHICTDPEQTHMRLYHYGVFHTYCALE